MPISRRGFLVSSSLSLAAGALAPFQAQAKPKLARVKKTYRDWQAVRREFQLDRDFIHLGLFYLTAHPRPVREAIEEYRERLDANPFLTVEMLEGKESNLPLKTCAAIAKYTGASAQDIALSQNTTTGLALIYHGLPLREGDEVLTTTHDHFVHHESIRLATERCGATFRKIPLFDSYDSISPDEVANRVKKAVRRNTRAVGVTWVHSSSGVRLPIRRIADALAEVNADRDEKDRVLLVVDGAHGLGVEDPSITEMGCDAFAAGTHKWIFGPRGTGFVWAKPSVWASMHPVIPTFSSSEPFQAWAQEKRPDGRPDGSWFSPGGFQAFEHYWALPAALEFHQAIGPARVTARIHELNKQMKEGMASMQHIELYTPREQGLSAGIVCFDIKGMKPWEVVKRLLKRKIVASVAPYAMPYARVACGITNTPQEVERTLRAIRALA
jgi:isopenicillin-N epimerase